MKKLFLAVSVILFALPLSAQNANPIAQPYQTFLNPNTGGAPCAGCLLYTYAAGTTTPLATYTDSTGNTPNTNPIVLDVAGGAQIWVKTSAIKFVLKDALGTTLWSADNIYPTACTATGCTFIGPITGTSATFSGTVAVGTALQGMNAGTAPPLGGDPTAALQATTKQYTDISGGRQAAQRFLYCTQQNTRDCYIDNFSDSTGYDYQSGGPYRYVWRLLNLWVSENKFPEWNIVYQEWDTSTNSFDAPITFQSGTGSHQMGDVTISSAGSGQTNGTYVLYDTGSGSAQCVANPASSHCAQVQITIAGGAITAAVPYNNGQFNPGDDYTSAPIFTVSEGGTPGTITASLYHTIYMSNVAISGSTPAVFQGQYAYAMLTGGTLNAYPDLIINNTGLNSGTIAGNSSSSEPIRQQLATLVSYEQWAAPNAGIMAIQQEPNFVDGSHMISEQEKGILWGQLCTATGIGCLNVYQAIMDDNTPVNQWQPDYFATNVSAATSGSGYTPGTYTTTGTCTGGSGPVLQYTISSGGSMVTSPALSTSPYVISMGTCPFANVPSFAIPGPGTGASVTIAAWTGGGTHMADYGFQLKAAYLDRAFVYAQDTNMRPSAPSSLSTLGGTQLAINGSLQSWTPAGIPAYATAGGSATLSKTTTAGTWETKGYALQIADAGGAYGAAMFPLYNTTGIAGQWITLTARVYVPAGATNNAGRIGLTIPTTTGTVSTVSFPAASGESTGGYVWRQVSIRVPTNVDANGTIYLYGSAGTEAVTVYYDRFSVTLGKYMHDVLNYDNTLAQSYASNQNFYGNLYLGPTGTATSTASPVNSPNFGWEGNYSNGSAGTNVSVTGAYILGTGSSPTGTLNVNFPTTIGAQKFAVNNASLQGNGVISSTDFQWTQSTPASSSAACTAGEVAVDQNYIYGCTATNTWKSSPWRTFSSYAGGLNVLTAGSATVSTTAACSPAATCIYKLTNCGTGGTIGILSVGTVTAGTSFVINSSSATDTSSVCWQIN